MKLKGSFAVEGSFVISICLLVLMGLMLLGYDIYYETGEFIKTTSASEYDGITVFRLVSAGVDFFGSFR